MKKNYILIFSFLYAMCHAQQSKTSGFNSNGLFQTSAMLQPSTTAETINAANETFTDIRELSEINIMLGLGYPWISGDGLRLYFVENNGIGLSIHYTSRPDFDSNFVPSVIVMPNLPISALSVWLSSDELDAYASSSFPASLYHLHRDSVNDTFGTPVLQVLPAEIVQYFSGISFTQDQNELYAFISPGVIGRFVRSSANTFSAAGTITFPDGVSINPGQLSKDGLYFIGSTGTPSSLKLLSRATTSDAFIGSDAELIEGLNDPNVVYTAQASVSDNKEWIVFIRSTDNTWTGNRLYIAHNSNLSVSEAQSASQTIDIYPNPSDGIIHFNWNQAKKDATLEIFNGIGQNILMQPMSDQVDLTQFQAGIYFAKITAPDFSATQKIILK